MVALAEAYYRIRPDTTGFAAEAQAQIRRHPINATATVDLDAAGLQARIAQIRAQIRDLGREKVRVDADVDAAMRQVAALKAELRAGGRDKVAVDADITAATARLDQFRARLRDIGRQRTTLSLDVGDAQGKLQQVKAELRSVDSQTARARVDVNVDGALRSLGLLTAAMAAAVGLAAGAGLAVGAGAVAGAGIGAAVAGLAGIGTAVKALGDAEKGAGQQAATAAARQLGMAGAMDRVAGAQAGLRNAVASASEAARRASEQEAGAQRDLTAAQQAVNTARAEATAQIRDLVRQQQVLARQAEDLAAAQRGSSLDIRQAQEDLDRVRADPKATRLQRDQAAFAFEEAVRHNAGLKRQAADLATQQQALAAQRAAADRRGVAGSDLVRAAQARVAAAQRGVRDASLNAASVQRQSAFQVAQAQQQVVDAQRAVQAASVSAGTVGQSSMDKIADAMRGLSPAGQGFARFLRGFIDGPVRDLRQATQTGLLPGLQAGLAGLGPVITRNLPAFGAFARVVGQALGGLITTAGRLVAPFLRLATVALGALAPLEGVFNSFADAFASMVDQVVGDGSLQRSMDAVVKLFAALLPVLPALLPPFVELATQVLPPLTALLVVLVPLVANLAVAFGPPLVGALRLVTPLLAWFGDFVRDHGPLVADLAVAVGLVIVAVKAWTLAQGALDVVLAANPIGLIAIAVAGLVAAFIIAWRHSETFRRIVIGAFVAVNDTVQAAWRWLKDNWPYLLGVLLGPFGLAAAWIYKHWDQVVDFVKRLPGRLAAAGSGMWDWIKQTFKDAINAIIRWWNNLEFTTPTVHVPWVGDVGGITIGTPNITPLATGGIIKARPGGMLANIGEGGRDEAVTPLDGPGGLEDSLYRAMARALDGAELRLERRGSEVMARIVRHGNLILDGL